MGQSGPPKAAENKIIERYGRKYIQAVLTEIELTPLKSGDLVINPPVIKVCIKEQAEKKRYFLLESDPIVIRVKRKAEKI